MTGKSAGPVAGDLYMYVRCSFQGKLQPFRSPIDEFKESIICFFTILMLLKGSIRFQVRDGPGCHDQGCGKAGGGVGQMAIYRFRQCDSQCVRQFVPDCTGTGFERFTCLDRSHELVTACFKKADIGAPIGDSPVGEQP